MLSIALLYIYMEWSLQNVFYIGVEEEIRQVLASQIDFLQSGTSNCVRRLIPKLLKKKTESNWKFSAFQLDQVRHEAVNCFENTCHGSQ